MERVILNPANIKIRAVCSRFEQKKLDTDCKIYLKNAFVAATTPPEVGLRGRTVRFIRYLRMGIGFLLLKSTTHCSKLYVCRIQYNSFPQENAYTAHEFSLTY